VELYLYPAVFIGEYLLAGTADDHRCLRSFDGRLAGV
jgi:hypothetical protein